MRPASDLKADFTFIATRSPYARYIDVSGRERRFLGGVVPVEVSADPVLAGRVYPMVRDDLLLSRSFTEATRALSVTGDIGVLGGTEDAASTRLEGWAAHTTGRCEVVRLPGGHLLSADNPGGVELHGVFGDDVVGLDRHELRRRFAVVPQDVVLFPGTIAENVAAGVEPDRERVRQVLTRIGAIDVFQSREGGLDAPVGEQGLNFSAGERQLIAFARALYRDAPILILDEATASIDSDTEARLQHALDELLRGRTALVIAHRLSTIRSADRILVLRKGRLVEEGTHEQLVELGGLYAKLHELQFSREQLLPTAEPAAAPA